MKLFTRWYSSVCMFSICCPWSSSCPNGRRILWLVDKVVALTCRLGPVSRSKTAWEFPPLAIWTRTPHSTHTMQQVPGNSICWRFLLANARTSSSKVIIVFSKIANDIPPRVFVHSASHDLQKTSHYYNKCLVKDRIMLIFQTK